MSETAPGQDGEQDAAGDEAVRPRKRVQRAFGVNTALWDNVLQAAGAGLGTLLGALPGYFFSGRRLQAALAGGFLGFIGGVFATGLILAVYRWFRPFEPDE